MATEDDGSPLAYTDFKPRTHPKTGNPIGEWKRSLGFRYWDGPCTCGSGEEGHELYDAKGIYSGITCKSCKRENTFRPEVFTDPDYWTDEQVEED